MGVIRTDAIIQESPDGPALAQVGCYLHLRGRLPWGGTMIWDGSGLGLRAAGTRLVLDCEHHLLEVECLAHVVTESGRGPVVLRFRVLAQLSRGRCDRDREIEDGG